MAQYLVSILHKDEKTQETVTRKIHSVTVEGLNDEEFVSPAIVNKRNSMAVQIAISKHMLDYGIFEGDSIHIEEVKRIK